MIFECVSRIWNIKVPRLLGMRLLSLFVPGLLGMVFATAASADQPRPWEMGLQQPATALMRELTDFHNMLLVVTTGIVILVLLLLLWCIVRFNEKANPVPSKTTHNTLLEVVWTTIPALILIGLSVPSYKLLVHQLDLPKPGLTVRAIGHQWYWSYEYPDNGNFAFDSRLIEEKDLKPGDLRLLATDNALVLPVDTDIRIQITSGDVIHSWTVPAFGVKHDAVPGRVNESWFNIEAEGTYYGQCSELCGVDHGFMPIKVVAVSKEKYKAWVAEAQKKFAKADEAPGDPGLPAFSMTAAAAPATGQIQKTN